MGIAASVRIDVVGDSEDSAKGRRLLDWLRSEPELSGTVAMLALSPMSEEKGWGEDTLVATLGSRAIILSLARAIREFLGRHHDVKIRITSASVAVEFDSGQNAPEVELLVDAISGSGVNNLITGSVSGTVVQARDIAGNISLGGASSAALLSDPWERARDQTDSSLLPITIYLSDAGIHDRVEAAVEQVLTVAGLRIESRDDPIFGSWFRRMWATATEKLRTPAGREALLVAAHAAETRLVLAPDADVTAKLLQGVGPVITSLESAENAVVRLGNVLIVKVNGVVAVSQLTPAQQFLLNHRPELACSPEKIIAALRDTASEEGGRPPALQ